MKKIVANLLIIIIVYLIFAFVCGDIDSSTWDEGERVMCVMFAGAGIFLKFMIDNPAY